MHRHAHCCLHTRVTTAVEAVGGDGSVAVHVARLHDTPLEAHRVEHEPDDMQGYLPLQLLEAQRKAAFAASAAVVVFAFVFVAAGDYGALLITLLPALAAMSSASSSSSLSSSAVRAAPFEHGSAKCVVVDLQEAAHAMVVHARYR